MEPIALAGLTMQISAPVVALDSSATTLSSTNALWAVINGKQVIHAAFSNHATTGSTAKVSPYDVNSGDLITVAVNKAKNLVFGLDASGNLLVAASEAVDVSAAGAPTLATDRLDLPEWPSIPDTMCPCFYVRVGAGATASTWTLGSSNWNATGVTCDVTSISALPNRPQ